MSLGGDIWVWKIRINPEELKQSEVNVDNGDDATHAASTLNRMGGIVSRLTQLINGNSRSSCALKVVGVFILLITYG